jgi:hypothetical protein
MCNLIYTSHNVNMYQKITYCTISMHILSQLKFKNY